MATIRGSKQVSDLGNYSVFSLQFPDGLLFISIVSANNLDAVIKASKLKLLVQLNSKLVGVKIGNNRCFVKYALDFESDRGAEGHASGATEGQVDLMLSVVIRSHMLGHSKGHREGGFSLASDFLLNGQTENINWKFIGRLVIGEGKGAARLPGPVSVIENLDLDRLRESGNDLNGLLRLALADGTSFLPALLALEVPLGVHGLVPLRSTLTNLVLPFRISPILALAILESVKEFADHLLVGIASFAASDVASVVSTAGLTKGLQHLTNESHRVLVLVGSLSLLSILRVISIVIDDNHNIRGTTRSPNLEHSVVVTLALFTRSAHIEVLLDGRLVANALDRLLVWAAIARYALMDNFSFLSCHININEILRLDELFENFSGLPLELLVDEVLNCFSGNSKLFNLGLLGALDLLFSRREGGVGLPDSKDELHVGVIGESEGHLHVIVILNDHPVITIVILELDLFWANVVLSSELVGCGDEGLIVSCRYTLEDGAFALGSEVKGKFDVLARVCCFNHCFGYVFLVNLLRVFGYQLNF